jgi:hypothetical protein
LAPSDNSDAIAIPHNGDLPATHQLSAHTLSGTPVDHTPIGYHFITTTRVYQGHGVWVYETCVENLANRYMEFNWFIPGPHSSVKQGCAIYSPRFKDTHDTLNGYAGCYLYGNDWTRNHETFLPHRDDEDAIQAEMKDPACANIPGRILEGAKASSDTDIAEALRSDLNLQLDVFAPSDPKRADATMMYVIANVFIHPEQDKGKYIHTVELIAAPANSDVKEIQPSAIRIRPESEIVRSYYIGNKNAQSDGTFALQYKEVISAELPLPKNPHLETTRFALIAEGGRTVADLFVPFWMERK